MPGVPGIQAFTWLELSRETGKNICKNYKRMGLHLTKMRPFFAPAEMPSSHEWADEQYFIISPYVISSAITAHTACGVKDNKGALPAKSSLVTRKSLVDGSAETLPACLTSGKCHPPKQTPSNKYMHIHGKFNYTSASQNPKIANHVFIKKEWASPSSQKPAWKSFNCHDQEGLHSKGTIHMSTYPSRTSCCISEVINL